MTSYCVSITEQTTGKCNLFVLYNIIEKIAELNRKTVYFYSPKHLEVEILQISRVYDLYNNEMLLARLSHMLYSDWLSLKCARR
jgi:hypothetical protein